MSVVLADWSMPGSRSKFRSVGVLNILQRLNVGLSKGFTVDANGNIILLNGSTTSFPSLNAVGVLTNDGGGNYSITAAGANGGGLPTGTSAHTLRFDGTNWVDSSALTNDGTTVKVLNQLRIDGTDGGGYRAVGFGGNTLGTNATMYSNGSYLAINTVNGSALYLNYDVTSDINFTQSGTLSMNAGKVTKYNNVAKDASHNGIPFTAWKDTQITQSANIPAHDFSTAITSATAGRYRMCCYLAVTTAATTSSLLPDCNLLCTDPTDSVAKTVTVAAAIAASSVGNGNTTATALSGCGICDAKAATTIKYSTTGYTSVGVTAMQYKLYATLEAM